MTLSLSTLVSVQLICSAFKSLITHPLMRVRRISVCSHCKVVIVCYNPLRQKVRDIPMVVYCLGRCLFLGVASPGLCPFPSTFLNGESFAYPCCIGPTSCKGDRPSVLLDNATACINHQGCTKYHVALREADIIMV